MALLAGVEASLAYMPPEAVSTVINALSKLSPRALRAVLPFPIKKPPPPAMLSVGMAMAANGASGAGGGGPSHVANVFKSASVAAATASTTATATAAAGPGGAGRPSASLLPALCLRALELANLLGPRCVRVSGVEWRIGDWGWTEKKKWTDALILP